MLSFTEVSWGLWFCRLVTTLYLLYQSKCPFVGYWFSDSPCSPSTYTCERSRRDHCYFCFFFWHTSDSSYTILLDYDAYSHTLMQNMYVYTYLVICSLSLYLPKMCMHNYICCRCVSMQLPVQCTVYVQRTCTSLVDLIKGLSSHVSPYINNYVKCMYPAAVYICTMWTPCNAGIMVMHIISHGCYIL